ncbi:NAD-dependent histone deacetylase SIR2 [Aspergillus bombycis]|uniref:tRNA (guanine(10)-N(2))-methyltransferase n=1 Tax=Aspergillus bombycis TaxID=109264 RepID=A0A1F8ACK4_9EURO|nr:NAD-dependent histone deacetylase SIR2 [Aspergillus bombycis]OGM49058.1 NAD-dependent histone deacetylase SIR2 [Aspergillus bombycis]
MGKPRPHKKKASKSKSKSVLSAGGSVSKQKMNEDPSKLLEQATTLLQTGQPDVALPVAQQALELAPANSPAQLSALNIVAEIYVELGEIDVARQHFMRAVELDPTGAIPESQGGGAEKFMWLAQLSELGGKDSVQWFEKGVSCLRQVIQQLEQSPGPAEAIELEEKKRKMANALCAVAEIYMTDLSWEEDAEARCETLITEALLVNSNAPEVLQTLASIRISQLRTDEARAALTKSLELWKDLPPEDPIVPDFATRISLARLLMEVTMELEALEVLERLILEDDQSVEAWYLGGWCLYLLAEKKEAPKEEELDSETPEARRHASLVASREWLKQGLILYESIQYEDKPVSDKSAPTAFPGDSQSQIYPGRSYMRVAKNSMMDLVPAPGGESSSLKNPVVEVEAVDMTSAEVEETVATENPVSAQGNISPSEEDSDSGESGDEWETQSLYEDAIQVLRDEQLREGVVPDACTLDEAIAFRKRLHEVGKAAFVEETIAQDKISTSLGIPDFRSKDTGLYSQLAHLGLSDPQEVFDIHIFRDDPSIFYSIAKDILPTEKKYSPTHGFIRLLQDKGKLLTNYTQNIDNIEANAGVLPEKIVQCHGSFATATCVKCEYKVSGDALFEDIRKGNVPECTSCQKAIEEDSLRPQGQKRKRSTNGTHKSRKSDGDESSEEEDYELPTPGVMKPDITFFGEDLPDEFGQRLIRHDRDKVDLVIVIGTSLKVAPVAEVPGVLPRHVPQIYISRTGCRRIATVFGHRISGPCLLRDGVLPEQVWWASVSMEYVVRFAQVHETFRRPEIESLAALAGIDLEIVYYDPFSPYCVVKLPNEADAHTLIARSILAKDVFELWGQGTNYEEVHADVRRRTQHRWDEFQKVSFRFTIDSFSGKRSMEAKRAIIQSFAYLGFDGPIRMKNPDEDFWVLEDFVSDIEIATRSPGATHAYSDVQEPRKIYLGRWLANSSRDVVLKYDLKKRRYISTTSMDAELSLVTANMAHAAPGRLFYDPFVGTGSFCVAAAHFGALTCGSDIDPRSFKGREKKEKAPMGLFTNFQQYGIESKFMDAFSSDLTNTPLLNRQFLDGIVCDPPYGVREGLRVLGTRDGSGREEVIIDGVPAHYRPGYIPPKKPYGFEAMQNDILAFASRTLVTDGRLCMWMPTSIDEDVELLIPMHPHLEVVSVSVQPFNQWSRRLITYRRLPEGQVSDISKARQKGDSEGISADDLNAFRRKYFTKNPNKRSEKGSPAPQQS